MSNPISRFFWWIIAREKAAQPSWLRFPDVTATRSPPPPNIPVGPAHKIHKNDYFCRDARRQPKRVMRIGNTENTPLFPESQSARAIESGKEAAKN